MSTASFSTDYSPDAVPVDVDFNVYWTDTNYTFLTTITYRLRYIPSVGQPVSLKSVVGNNSNTITFSQVNSQDIGFYTLNVTNIGTPTVYNSNANNNPLEVICFVEGTEILCINDQGEEEYIKVENMKNGMIVKTYLHGAKKLIAVDKRQYKNDKSVSQICKISGLPEQTKDLFLTGGHSILVDELTDQQKEKEEPYGTLDRTIDDKKLLLSYANENAEKIDDEETRNVYHIVLENDNIKGQYGVYANGVLAETMSIYWYNYINNTLNIGKSNYIL